MMGALPILIFIIVGAGVLAVLRPPARTLHPAGWIALAWWLGLLTAAAVIMAAAVATGRFHFWLLWAMLAAGAGALAWRGKLLAREFMSSWGDVEGRSYTNEKRKEEIGSPLRTAPPTINSTTFNKLTLFLAVVVALLAAQNVLLVARAGLSYPLVTFDAINNFGHKAQLWYETRDLQPDLLRDPEYLMYKRRYPPILPAGEAMWAYLLGGWDGARVKWMFLACWLSTGALIWAALRRRTGAPAAWLGAGMWFCVPMNLTYFYGGAMSGFADVPQAMAFAAGAAMAGELMGRKCGGAPERRTEEWRAAVLVGLLLAGAFWIKKEGLIFWAVMMAALLWCGAGLARLGVMAAIAAALHAINALAIQGLPDFLEKDISLAFPLGEIMARARLLPALLAEELGRGDNWGGELWGIYVAVWLYKVWRVPARRWVTRELATFAALAAAFAAILILTIHSYGRNFDWAFERLFIQILPLLIVATFSDFDPRPGRGGREPSTLRFEAREPIPPEVARGA